MPRTPSSAWSATSRCSGTTATTSRSCAFANNIRNIDGGAHLSGFRAALTRTMNAYAKKENLIKGNLTTTGEDFREGLTAIISVKVPDPQFEAQTKVRLDEPGGRELRREDGQRAVSGSFWRRTPPTPSASCSRASRRPQAREAARKAREIARKKQP